MKKEDRKEKPNTKWEKREIDRHTAVLVGHTGLERCSGFQTIYSILVSRTNMDYKYCK